MRSRTWWWTVAVAAMSACAVEHGNPPPGGAVERALGAAPGAGPQAGMPGPMHQVFDSLREHRAIGVDRVSLDVMLEPGAGRAAQEATMRAVADAEQRSDSTLGAIRVLGFLPPPAGHAQHPNGVPMIPIALLTWAPLGGWNAVGPTSLRAPHTTEVEFVSDLPNHEPVPGAGTGR